VAYDTSPSVPAIVTRDRVLPPAPEESTVDRCRVAPDGKRVAWVGDDGIEVCIFVAPIGGQAQRVVGLRHAEVDELAWSPGGEHIAYVIGNTLPTGLERRVGWAEPSAGELGRVDGAAFGWSATGRALIVADLRRQSLVHVDITTQREMILSSLADDGDVDYPPVVTVAPGGRHVAFTSRRENEDVSEVWLLGHQDAGAATLVTQIPGARARVFPFWSPKGRTLGMHVVHFQLGKSAIIVMRHLQGDGEIFHHHELLNAPFPPAWSPSGEHLAVWLAEGVGRMGALGPQTLALIDTRTRAVHALAGAETSVGAPRFLDARRMVLDGGATSELFRL
jgi:dipeptidyl aminopeptidase/acylaminoacyl peptidase